MIPRPFLAFLLALVGFLAACVPPALPAQYAGLVANRALPVLVQLEEREGDVAIEQHRGDDAGMNSALADVETRWAPLWTAWEAFVAAQHVWADAVEQKSDAATVKAAESAAVAAFCAVRKALPDKVPAEVLATVEVPCSP